jgi:hypothetical protein
MVRLASLAFALLASRLSAGGSRIMDYQDVLAINIVVCGILFELQNRCVYCNQRFVINDARILSPKV